MFVTGSTDQKSDCLFLGFHPVADVVALVFWEDRDKKGEHSECSFSEVNWDSLEVRQQYRSWDIRYSSVREAVVKDALRLPWIKQALQKVRDRFYKPLEPNQRMVVLRYIVDTFREFQELHVNDVLEEIYGPGVRLSEQRQVLNHRLRFTLESLRGSGDLLLRDDQHGGDMRMFGQGDVMPTPQALATLAAHEDGVRRHRDSVSLARAQTILGLAMLVMAAASLWLELQK